MMIARQKRRCCPQWAVTDVAFASDWISFVLVQSVRKSFRVVIRFSGSSICAASSDRDGDRAGEALRLLDNELPTRGAAPGVVPARAMDSLIVPTRQIWSTEGARGSEIIGPPRPLASRST